jgi:hypothetical protein
MRPVYLAAFLAAASILPAFADNPAPSVAPTAQRIRGKIEAYDPATRMLSITTLDKKPALITLEPDLRVIYNTRLRLADIKPGNFIGVTTLKAADGTLRAQEVHVFPDAMRGAGEGQYAASDANPNRLMTNATVAEVAATAGNKGTITLNYRGAVAAADDSCTGRASADTGCTGKATVFVAPGIPIIGLMVGDDSLLVPGMSVSVSAMPSSGGILQSSRLSVEKDGVKPIL